MSFDGKSNIAVHARHQLQFVIAVEYIICLSHDTVPAHVEVSLTWLEQHVVGLSLVTSHSNMLFLCSSREAMLCCTHSRDLRLLLGCINAVLMLSAQRNAQSHSMHTMSHVC